MSDRREYLILFRDYDENIMGTLTTLLSSNGVMISMDDETRATVRFDDRTYQLTYERDVQDDSEDMAELFVTDSEIRARIAICDRRIRVSCQDWPDDDIDVVLALVTNVQSVVKGFAYDVNAGYFIL